ncbi:MAG: antitoxin [Propionibacteriales bacterium]|nr:antitoxin [Propionibacteriales bacterium]
MGFLDDAKSKLTAAVDKHGDKISDGLDKAGALADKKTGGKYGDKIATGIDKAKGALDGLDGKDDDIDPKPPTV